jgi:endonuclease VIII
MEGPSLIILREEAEIFKGKKVIAASGYKFDDHDFFVGKTVIDLKTWGKHFLVCFKDFTLRIHYGLFGGYRINDSRPGKNSALSLVFRTGVFDSYIANLKIIEQPLEEVYDWRLDMLSDQWDPKVVKKKIREQLPDKQIGDILLDAKIFSGVGNIIRNEVLYRVKLHPESLLKAIPSAKLMAMIKETQTYSLDFLQWTRTKELKKHWEVYAQKVCPKGHEVQKIVTGKTKRNSFVCACMERFQLKV